MKNNNYYSQIISIYTFQYKNELYTFQYIMDYPLLIPENKFQIKLIELLEYNFSSENIDFGIKCSRGKIQT